MAILYVESFDHYANLGEIITIGGFTLVSGMVLDTTDNVPKPTSGVGQGPNHLRNVGSGGGRLTYGPTLASGVDQGSFAFWTNTSGNMRNQVVGLALGTSSIAVNYPNTSTYPPTFLVDGASIADLSTVMSPGSGWHWVCFEFDASGAEWDVSIYVDGALVASHTTTTTPGAGDAKNLYLQHGGNGSVPRWKGFVLADGATDLRAPRFFQPILPDEDVSNTGVTSTEGTDYDAVDNNDDASYLEFDTVGDKVELGLQSRADIDPAFDPGIVDALAIYSRGLSDGVTPDTLTVTVKDGSTAMQPGESMGVLPVGGASSYQIVQGADVSTLDNIHVEVEVS